MPAVPPRSSVPVLDKGPVGLGAVAAGAHDPDSEEACVVCLDKPRSALNCTWVLQPQCSAVDESVVQRTGPTPQCDV